MRSFGLPILLRSNFSKVVLSNPISVLTCFLNVDHICQQLKSTYTVTYAALNLGLLEKHFSKLSLFLLVTATAKVQTPFETYIIKDI